MGYISDMESTLILLGVAVILVVFVVVQYNGLIKLNNSVSEAFAQIEVQLRRRSDLIPNLVETVKGYAAHEKEALEKVVQARAAATSATGSAFFLASSSLGSRTAFFAESITNSGFAGLT